jgi:hypothetical protein
VSVINHPVAEELFQLAIERGFPHCTLLNTAANQINLSEARIRALETDIADVAKINVDLIKRNRALEEALEAAAGLRESDLDGADIYVHQWRNLLGSIPKPPATVSNDQTIIGSEAETPVRQVHSKSEHKRLTALGVECVVTPKETKGEPPTWEDLRGAAPDATGSLSSEAFVRKSRNEWDKETKGEAT